jgi:hypothetical protein
MRSGSTAWSGRRLLAAIVHLAGAAAGTCVGAIWTILFWPELAAHEFLSRNWDRYFSFTFLGALVIGLLAYWPFASVAERIDSKPSGDGSGFEGRAASSAASKRQRKV